jgi:hypothetical protein
VTAQQLHHLLLCLLLTLQHLLLLCCQLLLLLGPQHLVQVVEVAESEVVIWLAPLLKILGGIATAAAAGLCDTDLHMVCCC